jgi:thioredoxin 1
MTILVRTRYVVLIAMMFVLTSCSAFRMTKGKRPVFNACNLLINDYQIVTARSHHGHHNHRQAFTTTTTTTTTLYAEKIKFKNFEQVLDCFHGEPILIYFSAAKCGPCQLMKKEMKEVQSRIGDKLKMFNVDTEKWPHIASRLKVATLPCLVVFREGETLLRLEGLTPAESIVQQLNDVLGRT